MPRRHYDLPERDDPGYDAAAARAELESRGVTFSADTLDTGVRGGPDPEAINMTTYPKKVEADR